VARHYPCSGHCVRHDLCVGIGVGLGRDHVRDSSRGLSAACAVYWYSRNSSSPQSSQYFTSLIPSSNWSRRLASQLDQCPARSAILFRMGRQQYLYRYHLRPGPASGGNKPRQAGACRILFFSRSSSDSATQKSLARISPFSQTASSSPSFSQIVALRYHILTRS
jgi:hypothetical protein